MKAIKFIGKLLLWIVGIVVVIVLALPLWIGPVVKVGANAVVPQKTGTSFYLGAFALNPYSGKLSVGDVQLWNPRDFKVEEAVKLGSFDVSVDPLSLLGDTIVVRDIVLKDVFVSYVSNAKGENNFTVIQRNATGNNEAAKEQPPQPAQPPQASQNSEPKSSKKVIIDHLLIANVKVQIGPLTMPMPNIELSGIGRKSNGATFEEAWNQIYAQILQSFNAIGVNLDGLMKGLGDIKTDQVLKAIDAVQKVDVKGMTDVVNGMTTKTVDKTMGVTTKTVDKTMGATTKTVDKTLDATTKGVNKSVEKVGEQVEKAAETIKALKSLF